ncbi:MAG: MATE family efflux transporter [Prevotella sp.]|nr:MATE family efflux transporter [Staphylococcus sp.]MCM1350114.1 MATE family efflux transporter [Prevotella sp.]
MQNKMAIKPVNKLIWQMGLPMIISMILQTIYNIVDTAFVINIGEEGVAGNLALTYAFPIQLLIIAIGVGTGVGINALLSKSLGEGDKQKASTVVGNGIFLGLCIFVIFLLFGLFGTKPFIAMQAGGNEKVAKMGGEYLMICCIMSFGAIGFTVYERFLQATGKTLYSTIAQISGAIANIVLDYVFIYPYKMGITGAAWATVIGQIFSLIVAMLFHYLKNKEVDNNIKYLKPSTGIIKGIYRIGISAMIMQGLLSAMMLCVNLILGTAQNAELLQGSFGIYYKVMQFALFACFGLSNTIITMLSFNYAMRDKSRASDCIKWGIINTLIVSVAITILFEVLAQPLAMLFSLAGGVGGDEIKSVVVVAIRIASIGYVFMGFSIAVQGVLQALRYAVRPLVLATLRLIIFVLPVVWLFTLSQNATTILWWTFPIAEFLTMVVSVFMLLRVLKKDILIMKVD